MRKYAPLYDKDRDTWSVIYNDDYDEEWYHYLGGCDEQQAHSIANAMTEADNRA